jgi:hypothetical protein
MPGRNELNAGLVRQITQPIHWYFYGINFVDNLRPIERRHPGRDLVAVQLDQNTFEQLMGIRKLSGQQRLAAGDERILDVGPQAFAGVAINVVYQPAQPWIKCFPSVGG